MDDKILVDQFYEIWNGHRRDSSRYQDERSRGSLNGHAMIKKLQNSKDQTAHLIRVWFQSLSEEEQCSVVRSSMADSTIHRGVSFYFTDIHKTYRKLIK
ncbi:MAG: hypothetical protein M0R77_10565 [Gammaproteobacteria bacterium]|nr:hypothetical protein [Gammaproteobacteria bacterium]